MGVVGENRRHRLFADEAGVMRVANDLRGNRKYAVISTAESVASRVNERVALMRTPREAQLS